MNNKFYSIKEVCQIIGVHDVWLRRKIKNKAFPIHRFGKNIRVSKNDLERWIREMKVKNK